MRKGFESDPPVDLWLPLQADPASTNQGHYLAAAARLDPGVSIEQARAAMKVLGERFRAGNPKWMDPAESVAVVPMKDSMVEDVRLALLILLGAVGFVLLIACANVANLLLARAAVRQKELAIRAALGASRWRVVRQLLTESLILAGAGAVLGFAIGAAGVRALLMVAPGNIPRLTQTEGLNQTLPLLDWRVAAFTIGVAALTSILFGLFPALSFSNPDLTSTLKEGGRTGGGTLGRRSRSFLVISEVALALMLVTGATLLIRTFSGLRSVNPGIDPHNLLVLETSLAGGAYDSTAKVDAFVRQVAPRLEATSSAIRPPKAITTATSNGAPSRRTTSKRCGFLCCVAASSRNPMRAARRRWWWSTRPWPGNIGRTRIPSARSSSSAKGSARSLTTRPARWSGLSATCVKPAWMRWTKA
jgi:predicted permease